MFMDESLFFYGVRLPNMSRWRDQIAQINTEDDMHHFWHKQTSATEMVESWPFSLSTSLILITVTSQ